MNLADLYTHYWARVLDACTTMERRGVLLDVEAILASTVRAREEQAKELAAVRIWFASHDLGEINPDSQKDVPVFLYEKLAWPLPPVEGGLNAIKKRKEGKRPTAEASLAWLAANVATGQDLVGLQALQRYRKITKQVQFLEKLPTCLSVDGRLRCSFAPDTNTGRLSSKKPNLQQIPSSKDLYGIRAAFIPSPGYVLGVFDFKALEIYIMAHYLVTYYADWSLYEALSSGDVYGAQAIRTWPERLAGVTAREIKDHHDHAIRDTRRVSKILVLGTNYGKTPAGLALQLGVPDKVGREYYDAYFRGNPGIGQFQRDSFQLAADQGFVRTLLGRHRYIDLPKNATRSAEASAGRKATNTRVQGSAADWVYLCMLAVEGDAQLHAMGARLVLQVHDELVFEFPQENAAACFDRVMHLMVHPSEKFKLAFDLVVEGKNVNRWSEAK